MTVDVPIGVVDKGRPEDCHRRPGAEDFEEIVRHEGFVGANHKKGLC